MADDDEPKQEPKLPAGWGARRSAPKRWNEGTRTDDVTVRVVHPPLAPGIGTGKAFFFLFGYKRASDRDQEMMASELAKIDDDIETLRKAGYTVVVDPQGVREDLIDAVTGAGAGAEGLVPAGLYWSAHGDEDGSLQTCDGGLVRPEDLDPSKVSSGLRLAVLSACYVGSRSRTWRKALGGKALVVGWGRPVTLERAVDFLEPDDDTTTDLDDLIARYLLADAPLPEDHAETALPPPAATLGRSEGLTDRLAVIAQILGAQTIEEGSKRALMVPLHHGRSQRVDVFLVDGTEPYTEGEVLFGAEAAVGELSAVVTPELLLRGSGRVGYDRIALVASDTDMPRVVVQSFVPWSRATDAQLAAHVYHVAQKGDALEDAIFGVDRA